MLRHKHKKLRLTSALFRPRANMHFDQWDHKSTAECAWDPINQTRFGSDCNTIVGVHVYIVEENEKMSKKTFQKGHRGVLWVDETSWMAGRDQDIHVISIGSIGSRACQRPTALLFKRRKCVFLNFLAVWARWVQRCPQSLTVGSFGSLRSKEVRPSHRWSVRLKEN